MSIILSHLLDVEKYMLSELAYLHLPEDLSHRDFSAHPMPLAQYIDVIPRTRISYYRKRDSDGTHNIYLRERERRFREIIESSASLGDVLVVDYINDNYDAYGNTPNRRKTSLVALAFEDGDHNMAVVYSGCEESCPSAIFLDWTDCLAAALGAVTPQQKSALAFFDKQLAKNPREIGVIGHSKGGNLSTHIYVNRLSSGVSAYCINAQPYCWTILSDAQKAALKDERYEYIEHDGDIVSHAGLYQACASRVVPVNPYLGRARVIDFHSYASQQFDLRGNLTGQRILRKTASAVRSRLFGDNVREKARTREEALDKFEALLTDVQSIDRLSDLALEEICMACSVSAAVMLLRGQSARGSYLYPYMAKGSGAHKLHSVNLTPDAGRMQKALEQGFPVYYSAMSEESPHLQTIGNIMGMRITSAALVPIARDDAPYDGVLEILCDGDAVSADDLSLACEMAVRFAGRLAGVAPEAYPRPVSAGPLMRLRHADGTAFDINRYEYREMPLDAQSRKPWLDLFTRGAMAGGDALTFDGWQLDSSDRATLRHWSSIGVANIGARKPARRTVRACLEKNDTVLYTPEQAVRVAGLSAEKINARVCELEIYDRLCFELADALMRRTPLVVFDRSCAPKEAASFFRANLRLVCYDKLATVLVLTNDDNV